MGVSRVGGGVNNPPPRQGFSSVAPRRSVSPEAATARVNWSEVAGSGANGSAPCAPVGMVTAVAGAATAAAQSPLPSPHTYAAAAVAAHRSPVGSTNLTRWPAGQFTPIWDRGRQVSERSKIRNDRRRPCVSSSRDRRLIFARGICNYY